MKKEMFNNITISYMRNTGPYGPENLQLMTRFKEYLQAHDLYQPELAIVGIALDNPAFVAPDQLRYDVGIVNQETTVTDLPIRTIADGVYAIFEVAHTAEGVQGFWENLTSLTHNLVIDWQKPIIERYTLEKIEQHLCEFCVPLAE